MIKIFLPGDSLSFDNLSARLDATPLKYEIITDDGLAEARLTDGEFIAEGISAIEAYIESQEQFVDGWYDDRCDRYDFDPDASLQIKPDDK